MEGKKVGTTRVMNAHGSFGYHKNYLADKYTYSVLAIDKLSKDEKDKIRASVKILVTGQEAATKIGDGWTYEFMDAKGRMGMLKHRGIEVALFFKRQVVQERPGPGDPVPERLLDDPVDSWQRLDILGPSAKQANRFIKGEVEQLREKNHLLEQRCENLAALVDSFETDLSKAAKDVDRLEIQLKDWQKKGRRPILNQARALAGPKKGKV